MRVEITLEPGIAFRVRERKGIDDGAGGSSGHDEILSVYGVVAKPGT